MLHFNLPEIKTLIIHPGLAHLDDMFLAGLVNSLVPFVQIKRAVPTPEDLADPKVMVADVGGQHNTDLLNFDHHILGEPECSLFQVLTWLGTRLPEEEKPFFQTLFEPNPKTQRCWIKDLSFFDCNGPTKALEAHVPPPSAFEQFLTREFANDASRAHITSLVGGFWSDTFNKLSEMGANANKILEFSERVEFEPGIFVFLVNAKFNSATLWPGIEAIELLQNWELHNPALIIFGDDRGDGWGVVRRNDHPSFNFSKLASKFPEVVLFAHPNGFIFKTRQTMEFSDLFSLIRDGMIDIDIEEKQTLLRL